MLNEFIAVDWGMTGRRVFRVATDGTVLARSSDDRGTSNAPDFAAEVAALRGGDGDVPMLVAGMIGSARGWGPVPFVPIPAGVKAIAAGCTEVAPGVIVSPGVLFEDVLRPDEMRGKEVAVMGVIGDVGDGLICLPGTHTRWVEVEGGCIMRFRSVMTGDLLAALKTRSILSDLLEHQPQADEVFAEGVDHGLEQADLTAELCTVRTRVSTGAMTAADAASRIHGMLTGIDVRTGLGRIRADVVPLIGPPDLCARFALALRRAGRESTLIDGDTAFVAGARAIMAARAAA